MGFGGLLAATGDVGKGIRCPVLLFVRLPVGCGESVSVRFVGRCGSCLLRETVRLCPAGLVSILFGVRVARSLIWLGCRVAFAVFLI